MSASRTPIADSTLRFYLWRWAAAIAAQVKRIKSGQETGEYHSELFGSGSGDLWADCVLLLEAMVQFYRWYDHAAFRWPDISQLQKPTASFRLEVADIRKMTIHADEFIQGEGRGNSQARFLAQTPFQHSATTLQSVDGVLVFGGRLPLLDAAIDALECAKELSEKGFIQKG